MADKDDEAILICGNVRHVNELPAITDVCADCGTDILYTGDPDVPKEAVKVCTSCGFKRIAESGEPPEFIMTKQNEELLKKRGFKLTAEGNC